jgi:glycosyltransferase involved in cell wall biosynthesis
LGIKACFLPSYWPKPSLAALLAAKSLGIGTVLMCESHAGTSRSRGFASWVKHRLVRMFDAGLVGGHPQKRYYASLGLPQDRIFIGYDAVNNDYFAGRAQEVRSKAADIRRQYDLPPRYFLSLGRFVAKKNLATLLRSYRQFLDADSRPQTHLVMVGAGEEDARLRALCRDLRLPIYDHSATAAASPTPPTDVRQPGVHFYGFRQIEENPTFYALADAFILPSSWEEWGLVVNEAMCCGLPVVVSNTVGCAEDLVPALPPGSANHGQRSTRLDQDRRQNGFVFDPASVTALAESLLALEGDPALRQQMGQASRSIIQEFSCEAFARNALLAAQLALDAH